MSEDVKSTGVHIHSRADELIACLEGEIARRDAKYQRDVYGLNNEGDPIGGDPAGGYANDNLRLRAELSAIKAQEPVAFAFRYDDGSWHDVSATQHSAGMVSLYAAPVSEAKAQGVVMPERARIRMPCRMYDEPDAESPEFARGHNAALGYVERLNAPVERVSVPDGWKLVPVEPTEEMIRAGIQTGLIAKAQEEGPCHWQWTYPGGFYRAMLAAAPAAPDADAVLTASEWTKDAGEWGGALNYAAWEFINECPEKSALLFNNTKGPLRAAIMKYAELVAASAKEPSHD